MILDLLFPNRCIHCSRLIAPELLVCNLCFGQIRFTHYEYTEKNPVSEKCSLFFPVERAYALIQFEQESLSRKIIHELKYKSREKVGKTLAEWTIPRLDFKNETPDLITSIPLHPRKLRERGYNQLHLFTETLADFYRIPFHHALLKRNHYSKAQALKDKKHRVESANFLSVAHAVTGKHVLLIDDVFTTGNTISTAAWEILNAGDNKVSILVMAMDI